MSRRASLAYEREESLASDRPIPLSRIPLIKAREIFDVEFPLEEEAVINCVNVFQPMKYSRISRLSEVARRRDRRLFFVDD